MTSKVEKLTNFRCNFHEDINFDVVYGGANVHSSGPDLLWEQGCTFLDGNIKSVTCVCGHCVG